MNLKFSSLRLSKIKSEYSFDLERRRSCVWSLNVKNPKQLLLKFEIRTNNCKIIFDAASS